MHSNEVADGLCPLVQGSLVNAFGEQPLHIAARVGQDGIVRRLLRCGAEKHMPTQDQFRATPLHLAAAHGHHKVVEVLLDAKADPTVVDSRGLVPARWAERRGHPQLAELLDDARHQAGDFDLADLGRMTARGFSEVAEGVSSAFEGAFEVLSRNVQNVFGEEEEPAVPREMAGASGYREPPPEVLVDPAVQTLHKIEQQVTMLEQQDDHAAGGSRGWDDELTKAAEKLDGLSLEPGSEARQARKALIERIEQAQREIDRRTKNTLQSLAASRRLVESLESSCEPRQDWRLLQEATDCLDDLECANEDQRRERKDLLRRIEDVEAIWRSEKSR
ncbi:unnamed protein product [Durusdinium trenchii]|uniref:BAG domain-containing protein n=1 Tax=Durusdinium trenchii TaxID=1381693 RepID=A0ABP0L5U1_9DINO